jgi:phosphoglycerol transferase MdoB-like AlkP superfamily enzyme
VANFFSSPKAVKSDTTPEETLAFFTPYIEEEQDIVVTEKQPNVIVIMNESWWNTDNIVSEDTTIHTSLDPMGPIKELQERGASLGYVNVNVYGGGTINSEVEFLTGINTKYYMASDSVYKTIDAEAVPCITKYFESLGYSTTAIHPYFGIFYNRYKMYPKMGFDCILFRDDMDYQDPYTIFISDESLANQLIKEMEDKDNHSKFIWAVSIANHLETLDYDLGRNENCEYPIEVNFENDRLTDEDRSLVCDYLNGIYLSSKAFQLLTEAFEDYGEPVLIMMYGDHCPNFSDEVLKEFGIDSFERNEDTVERIYTTPVVCWNNYGGENVTASGENIMYLPEMLIHVAGLPDCELTKVLRSARNEMKADTRFIELDGEGNEIKKLSETQIGFIDNLRRLATFIIEGEEELNDAWIAIDDTTDRMLANVKGNSD